MEKELLITILGGLLSSIAIGVSIYSYYKSTRDKTYSDIDSLYFEFLKLGIEYANFRNPKFTNNYENEFKNDELSRYETYAFIAWNICETICDRKDEVLLETWQPVIIAENKLHRKWFDNPVNHHKFKESFRKHVCEKYPCD